MSVSEEEVERQLAAFETLLELSPLGFGFIDRELRFLRVNRVLADFHGLPLAEHAGRQVAALVPRLWPALEPLLRRALAGETILNHELTGTASINPGPPRHWRASYFPVRVGGEVIGVGVTVEDVTAGKQAEASLLNRNRLYQMLARTSQAAARCSSAAELFHVLCHIAVETGGFRFAWVGVASADRLEPIAWAGQDDGYLQQLVISLDEADPRSRGPTGRAALTGNAVVVNDFTSSDLTRPWHAAAARVGFAASAAFPLAQGGRKEDIAVLTLYAAVPGFFSEDLVTTLGELTPTVSMALEGFTRARQQRELVCQLGERVKELTALHEITRLTQTSELPLGQLLAGCAALLPPAFEHPALAESRTSFDGSAFTTPGFRDTRWKLGASFRLDDGRLGTVEVAYRDDPGRPFLPEEQQLLDSVAELLCAHVNRHLADERLRQVVMIDVIRVWELDLVRDRFQWLGAPPGSRTDLAPMSRASLLAMALPEDAPVLAAGIERAVSDPQAKGRFHAEFRVAFAGHAPTWHRAFGQLIRAPDGTPLRLFGLSVDISEQRQLEESLRQAQKLEVLGQFAGSIAHDFNNILAVILSNARMLEKSSALEGEDRELALEISRAGEFAVGLVRQILAFSRRQDLKPLAVDLADALGELQPMLRTLLGKPVKLEATFPPEALVAVVDPQQLKQVVLNLCVNARDAMPTGGTLALGLCGRRCGAPGDDGTPGEVSDWVVLEVRDTGTGIPPLVRNRIFEPFFTTKGEGKGTGLGLSTVYGIVRQSGGFIELDTELGRGTSFKVHFPRAP